MRAGSQILELDVYLTADRQVDIAIIHRWIASHPNNTIWWYRWWYHMIMICPVYAEVG
jgi:hypothetical protein